jgi:hypothetical protein
LRDLRSARVVFALRRVPGLDWNHSRNLEESFSKWSGLLSDLSSAIVAEKLKTEQRKI